MKIRLLFFISFLLIGLKGWGQSTTAVDFSQSANASITITYADRGNVPCSGGNCAVFVIALNPGSDLINVTSSLAHSDYYTVNCGAQTAIGTPVCIKGLTTATVAFCKNGAAQPTYTISVYSAVTTSSNLTLRQGCTGTMSVTGLDASTITWTSIYPGATGDYDSFLSCKSGCASTTVTPAVSASTPAYIDYQVTGNVTSCSSSRSETIRVYTANPLSVAVSPTNATICAGSTGNITLTATPTGGSAPYTYLWSTGATTQSIVVTSPATYSVAVGDNTNGCGTVSQSVTVSSAAVPTAPTAAGTTICSGTTGTVTATAPGGTYSWYDAATGGSLLYTGASFTTPALTATTTYYVSTTASGCTSSRTPVTVTVNTVAAPTAPGISICSGGVGTVTATAPGGTYNWYDAATGGNLLYTGASYTTPPLTATTTYYVDATVAGCTSSRTPVTVTVNTVAAPTAPGISICSGGVGTVTATAPGGTYNWYDAATGGNLLYTGASYTTPPLTATTTYYVDATVAGCTSSRTPVTVTVNTVAAPTAAGVTICSGTTGTVTATAPGGTYNWYDAATGGNLLYTGASYTTPALTATTTYYVSATIAGCTSSRTPVTVTVNTVAAPTAAGTTICGGTTGTVTATAPGGTYNWYDAATGGNLLYAGASYTTPALTATTTYYVSATVSGCTSSRTPVTVTVNTVAAPTAAGISICSGSVGTVTAMAPGGTYNWYDAATGGNLLYTGASYTTPALTATTTYYVSATVAGCTGPITAVTVTVNTVSAPTAAGVNICSGATGTITATAPGGGTYQWYDAASGGNLLSTGASYTTPALTATTTYYVAATVAGCTGPRTAVAVTVSPVPATPVIH